MSNKLFFAIALSVAAFAWSAMAQQPGQQSASRDTAIHRCINQAHRQFPGGEDQDIPRSEAYMACMTTAGFQP